MKGWLVFHTVLDHRDSPWETDKPWRERKKRDHQAACVAIVSEMSISKRGSRLDNLTIVSSVCEAEK